MNTLSMLVTSASGHNKRLCRHTFLGTGTTVYLENPEDRLKNAQIMATNSDKKTRLYDRRSDVVLQEDVGRIGI